LKNKEEVFMRKKFTSFILLLFVGVIFGYENPLYQISMDPADFQILVETQDDDNYYDAQITIDDVVYACEVRFRGSTSLALFPEKPSWKIKFPDDENPFLAEKINLNAEFGDRSLMRNHVMMKTFEMLDEPVSSSSYVNLEVNGNYMGLFHQIENIDEEFLDKKNINSDNMYKGVNHSCIMAPYVKWYQMKVAWDKKLDNDDNYEFLLPYFNRLFYSDEASGLEEVQNNYDIENVLNYLAIQFVFVSMDCFSKNYYLVYDENEGKFKMIPWDMDITFGNISPTGAFGDDAYTTIEFDHMSSHVLYRRLLDDPTYKAMFDEKVNSICTTVFESVSNEINTTYDTIKNDWYNQPDSLKVCSNSEFDAEIQRLHAFMGNRAAYLNDFEFPQSKFIGDFYASNAYPTEFNPNVTLRVTSEQPQNVLLLYAYNFEFGTTTTYDFGTQRLYDNGESYDLEANDSVYGCQLDTSEFPEGLIMYAYHGFDDESSLLEFQQKLNDRDHYPLNGLFYMGYVRTHMNALNKLGEYQNLETDCQITAVYESSNEKLIKLKNISERNVDLAYCYLQYGEEEQRIVFPENIQLEPSQSVIVTTDTDEAELYFSNEKIVGGLFFDLEIGNDIRLLDPKFDDVLNYTISEFSEVTLPTHPIVINEVNYNSADWLDSGDWIELYNNSAIAVDVSNWHFRDDNSDHDFVIPEGTEIEANGYLVIAQDQSLFDAVFSDVGNIVYGFDFGLGGNGDTVQILDENEVFVDAVEYEDSGDWPNSADGEGKTMELIYPELDNNDADSWDASLNNGTPGAQNSVYEIGNEAYSVSNKMTSKIYPMPYVMNKERSSLTIEFAMPKAGNVEISVYNIKGQKMFTSGEMKYEKGVQKYSLASFQKKNISTGIYFYKIKTDFGRVAERFLILK
jgi:spore coat protein H